MEEQTQQEKIGHLLMHVCRLRGMTADHLMEQSNLYRGQGLMLLFLSKHEGLTHSEIAEKLNISPAAATKVIKRLEKEGYLERRSDEKDERVSRVFLREGGRASMDEIRRSFKRLDQKMFGNFTEDDLNRFSDYLNRIIKNLRGDKQEE